MEYTKLGRAGLDVSRILPRLHELRRRQCVAPIVRPNRARADPDAHELSHRVQHDHRQCATIAPQAAGWARNAIRSRWRPIELPRKADLDAFQINFHGNRNLEQLLQSMDCFMQDVAPIVSCERPI
jgi:hypothetical protein